MLKGFICAWGLSDNTIEKLRKILRLPLKGCELNTKLYIYIWIQVGFFHIGEKFSNWTENPQTIKMLKLLAMKNAV